MFNAFDLSGKTAFITGGSRGLGLEFAKALGLAGANLFLVARNYEKLLDVKKELVAQGLTCQVYAADIRSDRDIDDAIRQCVVNYDEINILINNAAANRINCPIEDVRWKDWKWVLDNNIDGAFRVVQAVGRQMLKQGIGGKIVNLSSICGLSMLPITHPGAYDVSKHAVIGLTKALAVEWAPHGINVNAIAPGLFLTEPNIEFFSENPQAEGDMLRLIPAKRFGDPSELGGVVIFLASSASDYISGTVIPIDGGYLCW